MNDARSDYWDVELVLAVFIRRCRKTLATFPEMGLTELSFFWFHLIQLSFECLKFFADFYSSSFFLLGSR